MVFGVSRGGPPLCAVGGEGEYKGALREYREGLGSRAADFTGLRFDPFDDEVRGPLRGWMGPSGGVPMWEGERWGGACGRWRGVGAVPSP